MHKFDRFYSTLHERGGEGSGSGHWDFRRWGAEGLEGAAAQQTLQEYLHASIRTVHVGDEAALRAAVDAEAARDLGDPTKSPLWSVLRFVNDGAAAEPGGGFHVLLMRVHHVLGDGVALLSSLSACFEVADTKQPLRLEIARKMSGGRDPTQQTARPGLLPLARSLIAVLGLAATPYDHVTALAPADKASLQFTGPRRTCVMPSVRLAFVKALKNAAGATVNDVLVAAYAGTARRYGMLKHPDDFAAGTAMSHRLLLPVALPRGVENPAWAMRNKWAFASLQAPVGEATPLARLAAVRAHVAALKASPVVAVQYWVQSVLLPLLPTWLGQKTAYDIFSRHSTVFSNLPGPEECVAVAGCGEPLLGLQVTFPNLLPQALLLSYHGNIYFNLSLDGAAVDVALLREAWLAELAELALALHIPCAEGDMCDPAAQFLTRH